MNVVSGRLFQRQIVLLEARNRCPRISTVSKIPRTKWEFINTLRTGINLKILMLHTAIIVVGLFTPINYTSWAGLGIMVPPEKYVLIYFIGRNGKTMQLIMKYLSVN